MVLLNDTSSAGKSSIAGELVRLLDAPWFVMSADAFHAMRSAPAVGPDRLEGVLRRTGREFHRAVAGMAAGWSSSAEPAGRSPRTLTRPRPR
ncbi:phosphotransferase-like protein [Streptomyces sp. KE1]|uniref:phosphotransferase-like protein n=1 Tax=Streptomyces sp. KE1 TaxID=1638939 RepID=UPI0038D1BB44